MPNGKIGDHPLTDIVVHGRRVYSDVVDALVRKIVELGGREEIADMLLFEYNDLQNPDVSRLKHVLTEVHERLLRDARQRGKVPDTFWRLSC